MSQEIVLKVLHVSHSDLGGGAARSAYRIHQALLAQLVESRMIVNEKLSLDETVISHVGRVTNFYNWLRRAVAFALKRLAHRGSKVFRSPAVLPSRWVKFINEFYFY